MVQRLTVLSSQLAVMDPNMTVAQLQDYYYYNFIQVYNGNRAPFGIWLHPLWVMSNPDYAGWINDFLKNITSLPNVWLVSGA